MRLGLLLLGASLANALGAEPAKPPIGELGKPKPKPEALKNGDFSKAAPDGAPEDWKAAYHTGTFAVVKEGAESFLRVEVKDDPANAGVVQVIPVPKGSITAVVRGRMRGKPATSPKAAAQLVFWPKGSATTPIPPTIIPSEHSAAWKTETREIQLLPTVKTLEVSARCVFATGKFDFDDIDVQFK